MVSTPFGQFRLGDDQATQRWLLAHKIQHTQFQGGGLLDGPVDGKWMLRHAFSHIEMARKFKAPVVAADVELLRLPSSWRNEQELDSWHLLHNRLHKALVQAKGS